MSQASLVAFLSLSLSLFLGLSFFLYHLRHEELGTARAVKAKWALFYLSARMRGCCCALPQSVPESLQVVATSLRCVTTRPETDVRLTATLRLCNQ